MKMNELRLDQLLIWDDATGIGHGKPAVPQLYDAAYFKKYEHYDRTKLGCNLTDARLAFVRKHYFKGSLVDIGIGGGLFVLTANCRGYDINPHARAWLAAQERFVNPSLVAVDAMTFWDSMEHMDYPELLIQNARQWVFVSMPIYRSKEHCLGSKHFRPGEHVWYFTSTDWQSSCCKWGSNSLQSPTLKRGLDVRIFLRSLFNAPKENRNEH